MSAFRLSSVTGIAISGATGIAITVGAAIMVHQHQRIGVLEQRVVSAEALLVHLDTIEVRTNRQFDLLRVASNDIAVQQIPQSTDGLAAFVRIESGEINGVAGPHIIFEGVNVHVRSGGGTTGDDASGLGNLIVGYNEPPDRLGAAERRGGNNLIVGAEHKFSGSGGFVAGFRNSVRGVFASAAGGRQNNSNGLATSVSGGTGNTATGEAASITGGFGNVAGGRNASVVGGFNNTANADAAAVLGGAGNVARGNSATVAGGASNSAIGRTASIGGGANNIANAESSNVSGGNGNTASDDGASVLGGFSNTADGANAAIVGGNGNRADGRTSAVLGGAGVTASSESAVGGAVGLASTSSASDAGATVSVGLGVFNDNCAVCHTLEEGGRNKNGPNLFGVFGAAAGTREVAADATSRALKASDIVWSEETLDRWLSDIPQAFIPGTRMGFTGLDDPADRAAVIALLKSLE